MIKNIFLWILVSMGNICFTYSQSKVFFYAADLVKEPMDTFGITILDENTEYLNQTIMYFPYSMELKKEHTT